MTTLLDTFRVLTSFDPPKVNLRRAPWEDFVDWSIGQGVAPIAAYNLEYRMAGAGSPDWARERLMSVYQGTSNDNVMKLVNFKRSIDELEGRQVLVVGGAAFADALYPHVAFRPVPDIELWVHSRDVDPLAGYLARAEFRPDLKQKAPSGTRILSDGRTQLIIRGTPFGKDDEERLNALFSRAEPMRAFGPSLFRPSLEDALLIQSLALASTGFEVAMIELVDLRELVTGAPFVAGPYSRPCDFAAVRARAEEWRLERAVWAALTITARLFPETAERVQPGLPKLRAGTERRLERWVVGPAIELGRSRLTRGADRLKRLLTGTSRITV